MFYDFPSVYEILSRFLSLRNKVALYYKYLQDEAFSYLDNCIRNYVFHLQMFVFLLEWTPLIYNTNYSQKIPARDELFKS